MVRLPPFIISIQAKHRGTGASKAAAYKVTYHAALTHRMVIVDVACIAPTSIIEALSMVH